MMTRLGAATLVVIGQWKRSLLERHLHRCGGLAQETRIQTFTAEQAISGDTDLEIILDAEGDVLLQPSSVAALTIVVTITAETANQADNLRLQYRNTTTALSLTTQNVNLDECDGGASHTSSRSLTVLIYSLFISLFLSRWSRLSIWTLLLGLLVSVVAVQVYAINCTERADVTVLVPRNFTFNEVILSSRRGSVQIDSQFLELESALTCTSGQNDNTCSNCCNGNGKCVDGGCRCLSGYRGSEEENCAMQTESSFLLHTSPTDPTILTIETVDGEQIQVFGDKDEDGNALSIDSLKLDDASGNTTSVAFNPNTSFIDRVATSAGDYLNFEWSEDLDSVLVTGVSADGSSQITIHVDLNISTSSTDLRRSVQSVYSEKADDIQHNIKKRQSTSNGIANIQVTVQRCMQLEPDAEVFATALLNYEESAAGFQSNGENLYTAFATGVPGIFDIRIQVEPKSTVVMTVGEICKKAADTVGIACTALGVLDKYSPGIKIELIICGTLRLHPIGRLLGPVCDQGFRALRTYCSTLGASIVPVDPILGTQLGVPNYASIICDGVSQVSENLDQFIDSLKTTNILLQPYALFRDGYRVDAESQIVELRPGTSGLLAHFIIEDDRTLPMVTSLTVTPPDPAPGQDYIVIVTYICASSTTHISMSIIGTDSYTGQISCVGIQSSCILNVPGAEELVVDTVTIVITEPTQVYTFTRVVTVVF